MCTNEGHRYGRLKTHTTSMVRFFPRQYSGDCLLSSCPPYQLPNMQRHTLGPIIRLSPNEIHIRNSESYDAIYTSAPRKRDKWLWQTRMSSLSSAFPTVPHDLHGTRPGVMNSFFSKRRVVELEPRIRSKIDKLVARFSAVVAEGLHLAFSVTGRLPRVTLNEGSYPLASI